MRFDAADGLSWLSVQAYDPSIGRFLARDPLGRALLYLGDADNLYVHAGNNSPSDIHLNALALLPWRRNSVHRDNGVR